jgi:tRNA(Ile)-lysidine synthase
MLDLPRNRIRNELLPLLRNSYQPGLTKAVLRLMEIVGAEADLAGETARQWLVSHKLGRADLPVGQDVPGTTTSNVQEVRVPASLNFGALPVAVQRRVLQWQLTEFCVAPDFGLIEQLRESPGKFVSVSSSLSLARDAGGKLNRREYAASGFNANETAVNLAGRAGDMEFDGVRFGWRLAAGGNFVRPAGGNACESFDADKVGGKITLRHWRPGDRFQPIGFKLAVKLQDLFTNQKIPRARRRELMVAAAESGEIFWVEGLRISELFKLTLRTKRRLVWRWRRLAAV